MVLRIAGPVMIHACPAGTQQIAIIDCIFWFHSRASNFQQVWEKKGAEPQCNIAFFCKWFPQSMWLWLLHLHAIVWPPPQLQLWALRSLATATAQLQAGQMLCRWAQHGFCKFGTSLFRALQMQPCLYFSPRHSLNLNLFPWQCGNKLLCNCILPTVDTLLRPATCKNHMLQAVCGSNHAWPAAQECILIWSHMHLQHSHTATLLSYIEELNWSPKWFTFETSNTFFYTVVFGVSGVSAVTLWHSFLPDMPPSIYKNIFWRKTTRQEGYFCKIELQLQADTIGSLRIHGMKPSWFTLPRMGRSMDCSRQRGRQWKNWCYSANWKALQTFPKGPDLQNAMKIMVTCIQP